MSVDSIGETNVASLEVLDRIDGVSSSLEKVAQALSGNDCQNSFAFIFRGTPEAISDHAEATRKLADAVSNGFSELAEAIRSLKQL